MNRRDVLAAGAVLVTSGSALAQTSHMEHMDHAAANPLLEAASNCVKAGLVCFDHGQQMLAAGDTSFIACARAVDQMLTMCATLAKLASVRSPYLPLMAKAALAGCQNCEMECRKHADQHPPCKACADTCAVTAAECMKVSA